MKYLAGILILFSMTARAHDEGHGPELSDAGKYGGLVSAMVLKSDAGKGASAPLVYKAELVRAADGTTRVYLYDQTMKPLDLKQLEAKATATIGTRVKGKWTNTDFPLEQNRNSFVGKMPKPAAKPYDLDVTVKRGKDELLSAFDNLD